MNRLPSLLSRPSSFQVLAPLVLAPLPAGNSSLFILFCPVLRGVPEPCLSLFTRSCFSIVPKPSRHDRLQPSSPGLDSRDTNSALGPETAGNKPTPRTQPSVFRPALFACDSSRAHATSLSSLNLPRALSCSLSPTQREHFLSRQVFSNHYQPGESNSPQMHAHKHTHTRARTHTHTQHTR